MSIHSEFGSMSKELSSICQSSFLGMFCGSLYGGMIRSRMSYIDFMENNQATAFKSHFDAKVCRECCAIYNSKSKTELAPLSQKKLQDKISISFARGAWRYGWRLGLFTTSYV